MKTIKSLLERFWYLTEDFFKMCEKLTRKKIIDLVSTVLAVIIMIPLMIVLYGFFFFLFLFS